MKIVAAVKKNHKNHEAVQVATVNAGCLARKKANLVESLLI